MRYLLKVEKYSKWDGNSFYGALVNQKDQGNEYLVVSQCAHVCQRAVRFDNYLYIRTYHGGFHLYPKEMLFYIEKDYHEQYDLAKGLPEVCGKACRYLCEWYDKMMQSNDNDKDPLWTVVREGGPHHIKGYLEQYGKQLENTSRSEGAKELRSLYTIKV
jgi:hypothetical protein